MGVSVREATVDDAERVRDVHLASIGQLVGDTYTVEQVEAWAHPRDPSTYPIDADETWFLVAATGDDIVGFGWMTLEAGEYLRANVDGEIVGLYVHPDAVRRGVGTRIHASLEARAVRNDVGSIGLWASRNSIPFYESQGYDPLAERVVEYDGGVELTVVEMVKRPLR